MSSQQSTYTDNKVFGADEKDPVLIPRTSSRVDSSICESSPSILQHPTPQSNVLDETYAKVHTRRHTADSIEKFLESSVTLPLTNFYSTLVMWWNWQLDWSPLDKCSQPCWTVLQSIGIYECRPLPYVATPSEWRPTNLTSQELLQWRRWWSESCRFCDSSVSAYAGVVYLVILTDVGNLKTWVALLQS